MDAAVGGQVAEQRERADDEPTPESLHLQQAHGPAWSMDKKRRHFITIF
jgi:hypothetical protein